MTTRRPRSRNGAPLRMADDLIHQHGHVTPRSYAAHAGMRSRKHAYHVLRDLFLRGFLQSRRLWDGSVVFTTSFEDEAQP